MGFPVAGEAHAERLAAGQAVAHHVADDQSGPVPGERNDVVPVAAAVVARRRQAPPGDLELARRHVADGGAGRHQRLRDRPAPHQRQRAAEALAPGSYLVVSHACRDASPDSAATAAAVYQSRVAAQGRARTRAEIAGFFDGFTLIDPGLVWIPQWRPDNPEDVPEDPEKFWFLAGVARLTEP